MLKNIRWFVYEFGKFGHLDLDMLADMLECQGAGLFFGFVSATLIFVAPLVLLAILTTSVVISVYNLRKEARRAQEDDPPCD
jgi:hypothetical protein